MKDRLKDNRGIRRDRVARGSGNERFDQSDDLLGEIQSNNDDLEKVNADDTMFDDIEPDVPPLHSSGYVLQSLASFPFK